MSDLNEAVRIAYQQGRKDALEEVRAEIEERKVNEELGDVFMAHNIAINVALQIIDKHKGE